MSLQAILEQIRAAGELQVQEIRAQSEHDVQLTLGESKAAAQQIYQAAYQLALEPAARERARILNQAHFEAACQVGKAQESLVDIALEQVYEQVKNMRNSSRYPVFLRKTLLEMLPERSSLPETERHFILEADPRDRELLEKILLEEHLENQVEFSLICWGGLSARSVDGATRLVNTLESRIDRVLPYLKQQLLAWFGQDKTAVEGNPPLKIKNFA